MIENSSKHNLATKGRKPMEIYRRMEAVYGGWLYMVALYGDYSYTQMGMVEWCNKF